MRPMLNWRYAVIAVALAASLLLIGGSSDNETVFYLSKPLGFACGYAMCRLARRWEREGKLPEITNQQIK